MRAEPVTPKPRLLPGSPNRTRTPAAVGIALAQKKSGGGRPVVAVLGDGALQYSVQSLYTAAQLELKLIYLVPCDAEYAILKEFAVLEKTPNVPALDVPGLDIVSTAKGSVAPLCGPRPRRRSKKRLPPHLGLKVQ
jgi:hypothetical protein